MDAVTIWAPVINRTGFEPDRLLAEFARIPRLGLIEHLKGQFLLCLTTTIQNTNTTPKASTLARVSAYKVVHWMVIFFRASCTVQRRPQERNGQDTMRHRRQVDLLGLQNMCVRVSGLLRSGSMMDNAEDIP